MVRYTWYPGHMARAVREMAQRMGQVDLVVEVRDARVPLSSGNEGLLAAHKGKRRLLLLNKTDLADPSCLQASLARVREQALGSALGRQQQAQPGAGAGVPPSSSVLAMAGGSKDSRAMGKVLSAAVQWLARERPNADMSLAMVLGLPNVGKSSTINALKEAAANKGLLPGTEAQRKRAKAGPLPGVTRHIGGFKVSSSPPMYLLDTPGVLPPNLGDDVTALKLALTGAIRLELIDDRTQAKFLLGCLAARPRHRAALQHHIARLERGGGGGGSGSSSSSGSKAQGVPPKALPNTQPHQPAADGGRGELQQQQQQQGAAGDVVGSSSSSSRGGSVPPYSATMAVAAAAAASPMPSETTPRPAVAVAAAAAAGPGSSQPAAAEATATAPACLSAPSPSPASAPAATLCSSAGGGGSSSSSGSSAVPGAGPGAADSRRSLATTSAAAAADGRGSSGRAGSSRGRGGSSGSSAYLLQLCRALLQVTSQAAAATAATAAAPGATALPAAAATQQSIVSKGHTAASAASGANPTSTAATPAAAATASSPSHELQPLQLPGDQEDWMLQQLADVMTKGGSSGGAAAEAQLVARLLSAFRQGQLGRYTLDDVV